VADCSGCPRARNRARPGWVAPPREVPLSGILNVDKPAGMTSHDVVDAIRRLAGQRKVGHAGTLDPMATGVLLVCLGQATRVAEYLMRGRKRYRATVVLGAATDTYDGEGEIVSSGGPTDFSQEQIQAALAGFVGRIEQVPPLYSALKRDGQPLHRLARQGKTIELESRPVEIEEMSLLDWTSPSLVVELTCSPGTYVRSLAHDLGQRLDHVGAGCQPRAPGGGFRAWGGGDVPPAPRRSPSRLARDDRGGGRCATHSPGAACERQATFDGRGRSSSPPRL
jgi:tRNA pseudouridine(55) synthase